MESTSGPIVDERDAPLSLDEGGGPPLGTAWSLVVDGEEGWEADLEHAAPLPRVGERVEFITDGGTRRAFRVVEVVHTVQHSASQRPLVSAERTSPNAIVDASAEDGPPSLLRAGLPRVVVTAEDDA